MRRIIVPGSTIALQGPAENEFCRRVTNYTTANGGGYLSLSIISRLICIGYLLPFVAPLTVPFIFLLVALYNSSDHTGNSRCIYKTCTITGDNLYCGRGSIATNSPRRQPANHKSVRGVHKNSGNLRKPFQYDTAVLTSMATMHAHYMNTDNCVDEKCLHGKPHVCGSDVAINKGMVAN